MSLLLQGSVQIAVTAVTAVIVAHVATVVAIVVLVVMVVVTALVVVIVVHVVTEIARLAVMRLVLKRLVLTVRERLAQKHLVVTRLAQHQVVTLPAQHQVVTTSVHGSMMQSVRLLVSVAAKSARPLVTLATTESWPFKELAV